VEEDANACVHSGPAFTVALAATVVISAAACSSSDPGVTAAAPGATTTPTGVAPSDEAGYGDDPCGLLTAADVTAALRETFTATCPLGTTRVFLYSKT
jgi:hypothetical protein